MKTRPTALLCALLLVLSACSPAGHDRLTLSTLTWIGYAPLFYAKASGWLDEYNIELVQVVSLSENMYLFDAGNADAFVGTQYEYGVMSQDMPDLLPVMMFNRSNGGDVVLGNLALEDYQLAEHIDVYMEIDSINQLVLADFTEISGLDRSRFRLINADPTITSLLDTSQLDAPTLIVSYNPYDIILHRQGFQELASTADNLDLLVVDAMYTRAATLARHSAQFQALKEMVDRALLAIDEDPMAVFAAIQPYMQDLSAEEFVNALSNVEWLHKGLNPALGDRLHEAGFPTEALLH